MDLFVLAKWPYKGHKNEHLHIRIGIPHFQTNLCLPLSEQFKTWLAFFFYGDGHPPSIGVPKWWDDTRSSDRPGEATTGAGQNWWRYRQKSADFEDIGSTAIIHGFPGTFWFSIPSCPSFCGRFPRFLPLRCLARMAQVPTQLKMIAFGVLAIVTNFLHFFCELQNMFHYSESSLQQSAHLTLIGW